MFAGSLNSDSSSANGKNHPIALPGSYARTVGKIEVSELAPEEMGELHDRLGKWAAPTSRLGDGMRAQEIELEYRRPGGAFFVARSGGQLVGALAAGSFGLRGIVRGLWFDDTAPVSGVAWLLLRAALHEFEAARILRVLAFTTSGSSWEQEVWKSWGFASATNTRLLACHIMESRETPKSTAGVVIRPFQRGEAGLVGEALRRAPEIGFELWERQLLETAPLGRNRAFFVAWREAEPVGVLLGGTFGDLAAITHLWVREPERAAGIGQQLASHALLAFARAEAKRVQVILDADYLASMPFWSALGFQPHGLLKYVERALQDGIKGTA